MLKTEEGDNKESKKIISLLEPLKNSNSENDEKKEKKSFKNKNNVIILITLALLILGGIIFLIYKKIKINNVTLSYEEKRKNLINEINKKKYKNEIFSSEEIKANDIFTNKIVPTFQFNEDFYYDLAIKYKKEIENNPFFKDIYEMPKGAILHLHIEDCIDYIWLTEECLKDENYKNIYLRDYTNQIKTLFPLRLIYTLTPRLTNETDKEGKILIKDTSLKEILTKYKELNPNKTEYDYFHEHLSILPNEMEKIQTNSDAWSVFMPKYFFAYVLIHNPKFLRGHLLNTFRDNIKENIYRLESRARLGSLVDDNLNPISIEEELQIYKEVINEIHKENSNFSYGMIIEMIRNQKEETIKNNINKYYTLKSTRPDLTEFIIAMDLSGDEDHFRTFYELREAMDISEQLKEKYGFYLPWILHCGESIKYKNKNPIDGILRESRRFGHGINLIKYPNILEEIKKKDYAIEVNMVSNQLLRNTRDLRLHPGITYFNDGIKICLSNDDPTIYNTKGVSYDFFIATVAGEFNLLDLKIICRNSIESSIISEELKKKYLKSFEKDWKLFIDKFIKKHSK